MSFRTFLPSAIAALFIALAACAATTTQSSPSSDAGTPAACPAGPNKATASASLLPIGRACAQNQGPCDYEATPCPEVVNGAVFGYSCVCGDGGTWTCPAVSTRGQCAPLPDGGAGDGGNPSGTPLDATAPASDAMGPAQP
jgi:hypothetical protein